VREATDGQEALDAVASQEPDLIFLDIAMPKIDGLTVCRKLKNDPAQRLIPVVILTAMNDRATKLNGIEAGADDFLTKPFDAAELLVRTRVLLRERALNLKLDGAESVILALARVVEARDLYTVHHAERVGRYSRAIGQAYGVDEPTDLDALYRGGVLHDLGKAVIPSEILLKNGPLTDEEWAIMRTHSTAGERICQPLKSTAAYLSMIRHHHERFDGAGYPDHLVGEKTPLAARIAAVADAYDAMITARPYRNELGPERVRQELVLGAGRQWDAALVDVFLELLDRGAVTQIAAAAGQVSA
jgi:putative two-component system response regulator